MPSFQISVSPSRRAAARFIARVRRAIQKAYVERQQENGISQSEIARAIGVHRSVINRELRGHKDLTLGRVAELAWALGKTPSFELLDPKIADGSNVDPKHFAVRRSGDEEDFEQIEPRTEFFAKAA